MRLSLQNRLILSFLIIVFATSAAFVLLSNRLIASRFTDLVARSGQNYARKVAPILENYYTRYGSWDGVDALLENLSSFHERQAKELPPGLNMPFPSPVVSENNERLILLADGEIIVDTLPSGGGLIERRLVQKYGVSIFVSGKQVGIVAAPTSFGVFNDLQVRFLRDVNRTLLAAAILAILAVVIVGVIQSRSIVSPVRQLAVAATRVARGDYSQRVNVDRNDELGEMADAFNAMAGDLAKQQEIRRKSMADIAHELRTPLSVLQIDLESLEDGLMEFTPENIHLIRNEATHLNALVEDLRLLSQVDAGELRIERVPTEIGSIVREIVERECHLMREKKLTLDYQLPANELFVDGDIQRITQILINLVNNAAQHTQAGGRILIRANQDGDFVEISVQDNGDGIPAADLPYVFERLYRVEKSRSRNDGGTGLGLSIARSLVEAHGGKIWVESEEGYGSTFRFRLPLLV